MSEVEVREWLSANARVTGQITIDPNTLEVTVDGDCRIMSAPGELPIRFAHVAGDFDCVDAGQTFIVNPPRRVGGVFACDGQLEHYPPLIQLILHCDFRALRAWGNPPLEHEVNNYLARHTRPARDNQGNRDRKRWVLLLQQHLIDADVAPFTGPP